LWEIEIIARAEAFAPAARLYQASLTLLEVGQIIGQQPPLEMMREEDQSTWLVLATQSEAPVVENLLRDIADLAEFHLRAYTPVSEAQPEPGSSVESPPLPAKTQPTVSTNGSARNRDKTVRISIERLDTLLNLVGELVTHRTRLLQIEAMLLAHYGKGEVISALSEMTPNFSHVVSQLQEEVMHTRMLPLAFLFNKFPRLIRELTRAEGKQVNLLIEGEATELDRAVIEAIGDPLIHLLRNAVDHGIETPEVRLAAGKPTTGTIHLTATAAEGQVIITMADDGRGIDPGQIRQAAVERDLLSAEEAAQLSDDEAVDLIFRPSLSTAAQVTEMSGRGVGMDVVRTNIERLSGSVVITNQPGRGVSFCLTLPLTLALVQTMLVGVRNSLYAIPLTSINGSLYLDEATIQTVKNQPTLDWQGVILPILDLREFFKPRRPEQTSSNGTKPAIVLATWGKLRAGLIVDKVIGQQEIVVKALSPLMGHLPGLSGATILGDGRIAFIVDIPGLMNVALQARRQGER
jgi:two-component system chemotaxis sensor kinase CheA